MSDFTKNLSKLPNKDISSSIFASKGSSNTVGSFNVPASTSSSGVRNTVYSEKNSTNKVKSFTVQNASHQESSAAGEQQTNNIGKVYYDTVKVMENKIDKIYFDVENVSISCDRNLVEESMGIMKHFVMSENPTANHFKILDIPFVAFKEIIKYLECNKDVSKLDLAFRDEIIKTAEKLAMPELADEMTATDPTDLK